MMSNNRQKRKRGHVLRTLNCVYFDKIVGSGTFGVVFKAVEKETGDKVALKKIKMERESDGFPITAIREMKILKALKHENIVSLKEMITYDSENDTDMTSELAQTTGIVHGDIFMMFEFCEFDLSGLMRNPKVTLTEGHVKSYLKQLLYGVAYMHTNKILHRDIKGANLLVTRNNVLKIADWGLARSYYSADQKFTNPVVTQWYRSPELLLGSTGYGSEIDMWSIGCLFAEMKMRPHTPLLPGKDDINQLEMIYQLLGTPTGEVESTFKTLPHWEKMSFQRTYTPRLVSRFGRAFDQNTVQLLGKFLELDPKKRITAAAALDSEYFWQDPAPAAELLPTFDVESAFAMAEDERIRDEHEKHKQQQLEQQAQQGGDTNRTGPGGRFGPGRLGGRFGGPAGRSGGRVLAQSKYAVSKPPAAPTTTATTTASAAAVVSSSSAVSAHVSSASAATTAILPIQSSVSVTTVPTADVAPTASAPATTDGTMDEAI